MIFGNRILVLLPPQLHPVGGLVLNDLTSSMALPAWGPHAMAGSAQWVCAAKETKTPVEGKGGCKIGGGHHRSRKAHQAMGR